MRIAVLSSDSQWEELVNCSDQVEWVRIPHKKVLSEDPTFAAFFNLAGLITDQHDALFSRPVFINAVVETLRSSGAASNLLRINGWPGFLRRNGWEIAGQLSEEAKQILRVLKKDAIEVPDEPGLIGARIIAMIINEAFFALGEEVSTRKDIDTALKLGTNYPFGPFEWTGIIGADNILLLLRALALTDKRYLPSPLLIREASRAQL